LDSIVARFMTVGEAEAARSALDAADIECRVGDENMISVDWLFSNAVGGVKLFVREEDLEAAAEVLTSRATETDLAAPEVWLGSDPNHTSGACRACQSADIQRIPRLRIFVALSVIGFGVGVATGQPGLVLALVPALGLILAVTPSHRCRNCGERWTAGEEQERSLHAPPPEASDTADAVCPRCGSPELHRIVRRRLGVVPLIAAPLMVIVLPLWLVLPRWKCDVCGRRLWFPASKPSKPLGLD